MSGSTPPPRLPIGQLLVHHLRVFREQLLAAGEPIARDAGIPLRLSHLQRLRQHQSRRHTPNRPRRLGRNGPPVNGRTSRRPRKPRTPRTPTRPYRRPRETRRPHPSRLGSHSHRSRHHREHRSRLRTTPRTPKIRVDVLGPPRPPRRPQRHPRPRNTPTPDIPRHLSQRVHLPGSGPGDLRAAGRVTRTLPTVCPPDPRNCPITCLDSASQSAGHAPYPPKVPANRHVLVTQKERARLRNGTRVAVAVLSPSLIVFVRGAG